MNVTQMKQDLIVKLSRELKELRVDMRCCCITSTPFVLECGGIFINPEIRERRTTGKINWTDQPLRAHRFSRETAEALAKTLKNGAGETGKAVGIYQAVRARHAQVCSMLATLRQA